jgi:hypothetical protein
MKKYENLIYGVGAAIVILGALFKIQHWPYGSEILTLGMVIEAGIFLFSALTPAESEVEGGYVHVPNLEAYNNQLAVALDNIEQVNNMYDQQIKGMKGSNDMSNKMKEVNMHLESLSNVYRSILKTMKS